MKTTGLPNLFAVQARIALDNDLRGKGNAALAMALKQDVLAYIDRAGQTTADAIYTDLECDDIPMYLALRDLVRDGLVVGPNPYSADCPDSHTEMVYVSKPLYWLLHMTPRSGWECKRHSDDPGILRTIGGMLARCWRWIVGLLVALVVLAPTDALAHHGGLVESVSWLPWLAVVGLLAPMVVALVVGLRYSKLVAVVVVVAVLALAHSAYADPTPRGGRGADVADTVRATDGDPVTGKVKPARRRRRYRNPSLRRYAVRTDRWYGCDKNRHGLWVCTIRLETLMSGKHPTCKCLTQRSNGRMYSRCWCTQ